MRPERDAESPQVVAAAAIAPPAHLPPGSRVIAAMSGGVDSAVAAALACRAGYDVVGVSMRLGRARERAAGHRGCCSLDDFDDARRSAARLGIPHYVVDLREEFGEEPDLEEVYDHVVRQMQETLDALASERRLPLIG